MTLGLTGIMARFITQPITELSDAAQKIREGDLTSKAMIQGTDEIGTLGQVFNEMTDQLSFLVENLGDQLVHQTAQGLRVCGHFYNTAVACCQRTDTWAKRQE